MQHKCLECGNLLGVGGEDGWCEECLEDSLCLLIAEELLDDEWLNTADNEGVAP